MIKLPFGIQRGDTALAAVVERSAERAGVGPYQMAVLMTHFLEELVRAVADGHVVTIPGLGQFSPVLWQPNDHKHPAMVLPRFHAATAFKNEVSTCCPRGKAQDLKASAFRRRHATHVARPVSAQRTFTAMEAMRVRLVAQARKNYEAVSLVRTC